MARVRTPVNTALAALFVPTDAAAHVAEQGFVLLLPTGAYTAAGLAILLATMAFLFAQRGREMAFLSRRLRLPLPHAPRWAPIATSLASTGLLLLLLVIGLTGSRDPLSNPLPLVIWTGWWIILVVLQGVVGDVWHWINPWRGVFEIVSVKAPPLRMPPSLGVWPAILLFLAFSAFALADIAPDDPARLAKVVAGYWVFTSLGMLLFGANQWLTRCECFTIMFSLLAKLAPIQRQDAGLGLPGRALLVTAAGPSLGVFALLLLGIGSFDGLNETFWWLAQIGVNPLAFPGRSAVMVPTLLGMIGFTLALLASFTACVWAGHLLANKHKKPPPTLTSALGPFALTIIPIAFGYHIAHYLTAFLVNGQYLVGALTDPFATGADYLGLGTFYVTTGFFNTEASVRAIWLSQAAAVVIGHCLSLVLAHATAIRLYGAERAHLSQIPMSLFMIGYTYLGLWLLAAPRGA